MKPGDFDEMFNDFESMIDKLKYYAEMAKSSGSGEESEAETEEEGGEEEEDMSPKKDPKGAAILLALKRKMKE